MGVAAFTLSIMLLAFMRGGIDGIISGVGGGEGGIAVRAEDTTTTATYETLGGGVGETSSAKRQVESGGSWGKIRRMISDPLVLSLMLWSFFYVRPIMLA